MRSRSWTPRGHPFVVGGEGGLDFGLFQRFGGGVPFNRPEPSQIRQRNDGSSLPAEVDHLVRLGAVSRLHSHTGNDTGGLGARAYGLAGVRHRASQ